MNPAPSTVTAEPNPEFSVVVSETALPAASVTEKWVVCFDCGFTPPRPAISSDGVARSATIDDASFRAKPFEDSSRVSTVTKSGSPSCSLRTANARRIASAWR